MESCVKKRDFDGQSMDALFILDGTIWNGDLINA